MSLAPDADVGSRTTFSFPHRAELLDCRLSRSFYSGSSRTTQTQSGQPVQLCCLAPPSAWGGMGDRKEEIVEI